MKGFCSLFALKAVHNMEYMQHLVNAVCSPVVWQIEEKKKKRVRDLLNQKTGIKLVQKRKMLGWQIIFKTIHDCPCKYWIYGAEH